MSLLPSHIERIVSEHYVFRFGDYISRGFQLVNRNVGAFIGFIIVYFLIALALGIIPVIGQLASFIISPALAIGIYIGAYKLDRQEDVQFGDFFKGFEKLGPLFLTNILVALFVVAAAIPGIALMVSAGISSFNDYDGLDSMFSNPLFWAGVVVGFLPALYFGVSYIFAPMFVWFYNLDTWPAMEASRKLVGRQWTTHAVFLLVIGLVAVAGIILLGFGLLYTVPASQCALYAAFADITGLNEEEEGEGDIIDHFVPAP